MAAARGLARGGRAGPPGARAARGRGGLGGVGPGAGRALPRRPACGDASSGRTAGDGAGLNRREREFLAREPDGLRARQPAPAQPARCCASPPRRSRSSPGPCARGARHGPSARRRPRWRSGSARRRSSSRARPSLLLAAKASTLDDSPATRSNLLADPAANPAAIGIARGSGDRLLDEALSPDGRLLAVRGDDGDVVLFDARTLRRVGSPLSGTQPDRAYGQRRGLSAALRSARRAGRSRSGQRQDAAASVDLVGTGGALAARGRGSSELSRPTSRSRRTGGRSAPASP